MFVARLIRFSWRVLRRFHRRKGLLLTSAVAYNAMLSIVPLLGLALVLVSHVVDESAIVALLERQLDEMLPGSAAPLTRAFSAFVEKRALASGVSFVVLVVFSALAFRTLDDALSTVLDAPAPHRRQRHRFTSVLLPVFYVALVTAGLLVATLLAIGLDTLPQRGLLLFGFELTLARASRVFLRLLAFAASAAMLASFYRIMPEVHVRMRHAVLGGLVAALLWELVRRTLVWYFASVSLVGFIYGSLATVVVLLLSFEAAALVVLLGGTVIAEVGRSARAGLPWYLEPTGAL
jgi:YihY family inner membrane protein